MLRGLDAAEAPVDTGDVTQLGSILLELAHAVNSPRWPALAAVILAAIRAWKADEPQPVVLTLQKGGLINHKGGES